jgi:hypothetical protein
MVVTIEQIVVADTMETIAKVLAISLIVILAIILPSLLGDFIATHSPSFFAAIRYILQVIWHALQDLFMVGDHLNT